jgi:hypothetical protein
VPGTRFALLGVTGVARTQLTLTHVEAGEDVGVLGAFTPPLPAASTPLLAVSPPPTGRGRSVVRPVAVPSADSRAAVTRALTAKGMRITAPRLSQTVRADLNNDGREEEVCIANSPEARRGGQASQQGFYSAAVLRFTRPNGSRAVAPLRAVALPRGAHRSDQVRYTLLAVADLDGDGRSEVVLHQQDYESSDLIVFSFDGTTVRTALDGQDASASGRAVPALTERAEPGATTRRARRAERTAPTTTTATGIVLFEQGSVLMAMPAAGGSGVRPATEAERARWRRRPTHVSPEAPVTGRSPDGRYEVDADDLSGRVVVREVGGSGRVLLTERELTPLVRAGTADGRGTLDETGVVPRGWLAGAGHLLAVGGRVQYQERTMRSRAVVDVATGARLPFDGWLAPGGRTAIVPSTEGLAVLDVRRVRRNNTFGGTSLAQPTYYAVRLPGGPARYRFASAAKLPLVLDGRPYGLYPFSEVTFSADGRWALEVNGAASHLVDLSTGRVRLLPGGPYLLL